MFERSDEDDWFLAGGNVLRQVEPVVEVGGQRRFMMPISLSMAPVAPEPQKITQVSVSPPPASWMIRRASSRRRVVCRPVPEDSVWVLAYRGSTS